MKQRRARVVASKTHIHHINDVINITKLDAFLFEQLQLETNALLGEKATPFLMPRVWLKCAADIVVLVATKLFLLTPLMKLRKLNAEIEAIVARLERFGRQVIKNNERALFGFANKHQSGT
eukprot:TRINITY_DN2493_c0_g1_i1.p1 TRINITY_DN2493_c0_g1~~TRINITY_DN2493_c0_g1_i1.p1  ORF type:complete len:121 (-),score=9.59 TRINITY_DN2493_c0_g1_i1:212-574(-)